MYVDSLSTDNAHSFKHMACLSTILVCQSLILQSSYRSATAEFLIERLGRNTRKRIYQYRNDMICAHHIPLHFIINHIIWLLERNRLINAMYAYLCASLNGYLSKWIDGV